MLGLVIATSNTRSTRKLTGGASRLGGRRLPWFVGPHPDMKRLVEIRSYRLKSGTAAQFHSAAARTVVPMLREWGMDVVAFGPSAHESDAYFLIRAYDDLADLSAQQEAFYGSSLWRDGPRESIVSRIESYLSTVLWLSPESLEDLRRSNVDAAKGVDNDECD